MVATATYSAPKWTILESDKPDAEVTMRVLRLTQIAGKVVQARRITRGWRTGCCRGAGTAYPPGSGRARTAADGSYAIDLPPDQSYMVNVHDDEWAARSRTGVVVREGQPHAGVDLRLERGSVIRGRITAGQDSRPALGLAVILFEQGPAVPKGTFKEQPRGLAAGIEPYCRYRRGRPLRVPRRAGGLQVHRAKPGEETRPTLQSSSRSAMGKRSRRISDSLALIGHGAAPAESCGRGKPTGRRSRVRLSSASRSDPKPRRFEDSPMTWVALNSAGCSAGT